MTAILSADNLVGRTTCLTALVEEQIGATLAPQGSRIWSAVELLGTEEVALTGGTIRNIDILLGNLCRTADIRRIRMGIAVDGILVNALARTGLIIARLAGLVLQDALGAHMIPIAALGVVKVDTILYNAAVIKFARLAIRSLCPNARLGHVIEVLIFLAGAIKWSLFIGTIIIAEAGLGIIDKFIRCIHTGHSTVISSVQSLHTLQRVLIEKWCQSRADAIGTL